MQPFFERKNKQRQKIILFELPDVCATSNVSFALKGFAIPFR